MLISYIKKFFLVGIFSLSVSSVFAEDAPVYDVDSYPPQFDGQPSTLGAPQPPVPSAPTTPTPVHSPAVDQPFAQPQTSLTLEQRVARLEQQINNATHSDVQAKVDGMQTEIQTLRGQVEDLLHQLQQSQVQQKAKPSIDNAEVMNADGAMDDAITVAPPKSKPKPKLTPATIDAPSTDETPENLMDAQLSNAEAAANNEQPNVAEEQQIYQTAYKLIKAKKYNEAALTLQKMLKRYPSGQFAANAHYWLGELYGLMNKNDQAVTEFSLIVKNYPESPKIADAQLKLGLIYATQSKWSDAKSAFKKVINNYPGTASAHLATEQLKQIKQAGH
jgi:tol-pal system protein YbgF